MTVSPGTEDWIPDACTLPTVEQPIRVAEFDRLCTDAVRLSRRQTSARLELVLTPDAERSARDLAARESNCCSFFVFDFDHTETGLVMGIEVPAGYVDVLDAFAARVDAARGGGR